MKLRNAVGLTTVGLFASLILARSVYGAVLTYSASEFSRFCASNPLVCSKKDTNGKKFGLKCPDFNNQTATKVYVHAGDGQTIYEMPHDGFNYAINLYGEGGAEVEVTTHKHDLSWVAVVCTLNGTPTVTQSPTMTNTPTPTLTAAPSVSETPTPTTTNGENRNNSSSNSGSSDSGRGGAEILGATTLAFTGGTYSEIPTMIFLGGLSIFLQGLKVFLKK